jgi:hypothetical protein
MPIKMAFLGKEYSLMATSVVVISDLSGETGAKTRMITVGSATYEIDLTDAEFAEYEAAVARYVKAGRLVTRDKVARTSSRGQRPARHTSPETAAIKEWGREAGWAVPSRGRLPQALIDAYHAAQSK